MWAFGSPSPKPPFNATGFRHPLPVYFLYVLTVLIWGSSWFAMLFQVGVVPVEQSIAYRFLLAGALMLVFCLATGRRLRFAARDHLYFALQGFSLFAINYLLFYYALPYLPSGLLAVCFSTILVMNIANGMMLFGNRSDRAVAIGAALGMAGIALLFWPEIATVDVGHGAAIGLALSLAATYFASLGNMVSVRHKATALPVISSNAWGMSYGGLFTLILATVVAPDFTFDPRLPYVGSLLFLSVLASVVAFTTYLTLVQRIGADRAAYSTVLFPVIALAMSTLYEGYEWTWPAAFGVLLVIAGNIVVLRRKKPIPAVQAARP
jgi:drug/metabolite transporter (DMT)-like permease